MDVVTRILAPIAAAALLVVVLPAAPTRAADFGPVPNPVLTASDTRDGAVLGGRLVFGAATSSGFEPWISDGTRAGTRLLKDLSPGSTSSGPRGFTAFGGKVYFAAADAGTLTLWVTDGTSAGTRVVRSPGVGGPVGVQDLVPAGDRLFFTADDGTHGYELWVSDGTDAGTRLVRDLRPGATGSNVADLTPLGDKVVFAADPQSGVTKPWVSDGSFAGTQRLDVEPEDRNLAARNFEVLGDQVLFQAGNQFSGGELWTTKGVPGDAHGLKDIRPGAVGSQPAALTRFGDQIIFVAATDRDGRELWVSDGTYAGTQQLRDIHPSGNSHPDWFKVVGGTLFFIATDGTHGRELWSTRGSTATTRMVRDIWPGSGGGTEATFDEIAVVGSRLYFRASDGTHGQEPWVTDGTATGTRMVQDLFPGATGSDPDVIGAVGRTVLFRARAGSQAVWSWTASGSTTRVAARRAYTQKAAARKQIVVTVAVRGEGVTPTGRVVLRRGAKVVGSGTLVRGVAKVRITTKLAKGTHRLRASYAGSVHARTSVSPFVTVKVR